MASAEHSRRSNRQSEVCSLGQLLLRLLAGQSQRALAAKLAASSAQINRWIDGSKSMPHHYLRDLSEVLNLSIEDQQTLALTWDVSDLRLRIDRELADQFHCEHRVVQNVFALISELSKSPASLSKSNWEIYHSVAMLKFLNYLLVQIRRTFGKRNNDMGFISPHNLERFLGYSKSNILVNLLTAFRECGARNQIMMDAYTEIENSLTEAARYDYSGRKPALLVSHAIHVLDRAEMQSAQYNSRTDEDNLENWRVKNVARVRASSDADTVVRFVSDTMKDARRWNYHLEFERSHFSKFARQFPAGGPNGISELEVALARVLTEIEVGPSANAKVLHYYVAKHLLKLADGARKEYWRNELDTLVVSDVRLNGVVASLTGTPGPLT